VIKSGVKHPGNTYGSKRIIVPGNSDTEADTCRKEVTPRLYASEWTDEKRILEQRTFTDGKIIIWARLPKGKSPKKQIASCARSKLSIAVIEAKKKYKSASDGLQQAREYAETLGCPFAYATNGAEIVEFDFVTGTETVITSYPTPHELWNRFQTSRPIQDNVKEILLKPLNSNSGRSPRYYQEIAVTGLYNPYWKTGSACFLLSQPEQERLLLPSRLSINSGTTAGYKQEKHGVRRYCSWQTAKFWWMTPMQKTSPSLAMPVHRFLTTVPPPAAKSTFPRISHWQKAKPAKVCSGGFRATFLTWL
jgi:hypothetical protein